MKAEKYLSIGDIRLVPVVEVRLGCRHINGCAFFSAVKQPVAVVLLSAETKKAFNLEGKEMPLDEVAGLLGCEI